MFRSLYDFIVLLFRFWIPLEIRDPENRMVIITGCDSGFGQILSQRLLKLGYYVVALCLTDRGVQEFKEFAENSTCQNFFAEKCDVTKESDVQNVYEHIVSILDSHSNLKVWSLINNAGITSSGYADWLSMESYRRTMEVNFFATVLVTKSLLPLLKKTKHSRIINLGSIAGICGGPFLSAYGASKHALEGFAKSLRLELIPWNIHVTNINPAVMKYDYSWCSCDILYRISFVELLL